MERKIGEIFEYKGQWYQCVEGGIYCPDCVFFRKKCNSQVLGECGALNRSDKEDVIFKKLEKVGEPYEFNGHIFQEYHVFEEPIFTENYATIREFGVNPKISIEIKQNKEDMEESNNAKHSNSEKVGKNLKEFNLEAAKAGKPVCTRDGRKARIICFDGKGDQPIIALVEAKGNKDALIEKVERYFINGHSVFEVRETNNDLMMLPEKKEGWVNVYKERIYSTKEEAIEATYDGVTYVDTVKVCWEE